MVWDCCTTLRVLPVNCPSLLLPESLLRSPNRFTSRRERPVFSVSRLTVMRSWTFSRGYVRYEPGVLSASPSTSFIDLAKLRSALQGEIVQRICMLLQSH